MRRACIDKISIIRGFGIYIYMVFVLAAARVARDLYICSQNKHSGKFKIEKFGVDFFLSVSTHKHMSTWHARMYRCFEGLPGYLPNGAVLYLYRQYRDKPLCLFLFACGAYNILYLGECRSVCVRIIT